MIVAPATARRASLGHFDSVAPDGKVPPGPRARRSPNTIASLMHDLRLALVGFGNVGRRFAEQLRAPYARALREAVDQTAHAVLSDLLEVAREV